MKKLTVSNRLIVVLIIFSFIIAALSYFRWVFLLFPPTSVSYANMFFSQLLLEILKIPYDEFTWQGAIAYILFTFTLLIITGLPLTIKSPGKETKKLTAALAYCSFLLAVPAALAVSDTFSYFVSKSIFSWMPVALSVALLLLFPLFLYVPSTKIKAALIIFVKIFTLLTFILYTVTLLFWPLQPPSEML